MKIKLSKIIFLSIIVLNTFYFFSCNKNDDSDKYFQSNMELNVQESSEVYKNQNTFLHPDSYSGKTVVVFFGYGYNDENFYNSSLQVLSEKFGLKENGGLIYPILYPDDLHSRIANFYGAISDFDLEGIILLGAPERTHTVIARLQDSWNSQEHYSVFSFFPQDDILGQEATSSFVIEGETSTMEKSIDSEITQTRDEDFKQILVNAITYLTELNSSISQDKNLIYHVQSIVGDKKIHHYIDSETGLSSKNHFIIEN